MSSQRNRLLPANAATALVAGAGAGALGCAFGVAAMAIATGGITRAGAALLAIPYLLIGSFLVFAIGLGVFGPALWAICERLGWRRLWHAVALCAAASYAACLGIALAFNASGPLPSPLWRVALDTLPIALDGALVGWVVWWMAYGRRAA